MTGPLLLTAPKAAKRLGVSVKTLRLLVARGLPRIVVGKRALFVEAEMADWLKREAERSMAPTAVPSHRRHRTLPPVPLSFEEACARMVTPQRPKRRPAPAAS